MVRVNLAKTRNLAVDSVLIYEFRYEPGGNRVEVANAGARLILAPDWEPVVWTEADRRKGQAWGLKTIESFHTHGTPPVEKAGE